MLRNLLRLRRWYFGVLVDGCSHSSDKAWTELYAMHLEGDMFDTYVYQHTLMRFRVLELFAELFAALGGIERKRPEEG